MSSSVQNRHRILIYILCEEILNFSACMCGTKANLRPKQLPWGSNSTSVSHVFLAGNLGLSVASDPAADGDRADVVAGVREHDVDGGPLHGRLRSGRKKEAEKSAGANLLKSVFPHQSSGRTHIFWEDLTSLQEDPTFATLWNMRQTSKSSRSSHKAIH